MQGLLLGRYRLAAPGHSDIEAPIGTSARWRAGEWRLVIEDPSVVEGISPVTGASAPLVGTIAAEKVLALYRKELGFDASSYFDGLETVSIFRCSDTGLRFYGPETLVGRQYLYQHLQSFEWFYKPDKWEYDEAAKYVRPGHRVLDVGCGEGNFLKKAKAAGAEVTGLEYSDSAIALGRKAGIEILAESIEDYARNNAEAYDVVASFQVLEHVTQAKSFLDGAIGALKPGGTLIIGVPNNKSFVGLDDLAPLNMPPHHMGLWDADSLSALPRFFGIDLVTTVFEPLAEPDWFQSVMERRYLGEGLKKKLYYWLGGPQALARAIRENSAAIHGHTVMAVYKKR